MKDNRAALLFRISTAAGFAVPGASLLSLFGRGSIGIWAKQGAEFLDASPSETIPRQSEFTLHPW